jgi:hypothetical protein
MEIISFVNLGKWGRLGNQLFEVAGIIGLCNRYGALPAFPANWNYRDEFNVPGEYFQDVLPDVSVPPKQFNYDPCLLEEAKHYRIVDIREYLQSEKYFYHVRDKIKKYLTPKGTKYLGDFSVGIHVRRGDFVGHPFFQQLGPEYFLSAIRQYFPDSQYRFYVCSDDPGYCKNHFIGEEFIIEERSEIDDLRLLAGCRHHILANSTFGWWGAYLADTALVIRPPKIFAGYNSKIHYEEGFWPEEWIIHEGFKAGFMSSLFRNSPDEKRARELITALRKITNELFINASFAESPGLMHGKMGICIFFYHFAQITETKTYEDFAGELLDNIFEEINSETPFDFEKGLAGIGWGIEYLVQSGFVEGDTDEALAEIDQKLYQELTSNPPSAIGFLSGILGIGIYFLSRIKNKHANKKILMLTIEDMIIQFIDELERRIEKLDPPSEFFSCGSSMFDLSWDYPLLLCLLAEIYEKGLATQKVGQIIRSLLNPLKIESNIPKLHYNRLLMAVVIEKLRKCKIDTTDIIDSGLLPQNLAGSRNNSDEIFGTIIDKCLAGFDICKLIKELEIINTELNEFKIGASWIYSKLFDVKDFQDEKIQVFWHTIDRALKDQICGSQWFERQNKREKKSLGLLKGFSGAGLLLIS